MKKQYYIKINDDTKIITSDTNIVNTLAKLQDEIKYYVAYNNSFQSKEDNNKVNRRELEFLLELTTETICETTLQLFGYEVEEKEWIWTKKK